MPAESTIVDLLGAGGGGAGGGVVLTLLIQRLLGKPAEDKGGRATLDRIESGINTLTNEQRETVRHVDLVNTSIQRSNELLAEMRGYFRGAGGSN